MSKLLPGSQLAKAKIYDPIIVYFSVPLPVVGLASSALNGSAVSLSWQAGAGSTQDSFQVNYTHFQSQA